MNKGSKSHGSLSTRLAGILLASLLLASATSAPLANPGGQFGPITPEHTLWRIASENLPDESVTIYQYMLALVEANPHAFIAGNANLMRSGQMLTLPAASAASAVPADEARERLRQQNEWVASLSPQELRAVRLGEAPADPPRVAAEPERLPTFEPDPEPTPVADAEPDVEPAAVPEDAEWPGTQDDAIEAMAESPAEMPWTDDAGLRMDPETEVESEAVAEPIPEPELLTQPGTAQPPAVTRPAEPQPLEQTVFDTRQNESLTWLYAVLAVVVLLILAVVLWRRRSAAEAAAVADIDPEAPRPVAPAPSAAKAAAAGPANTGPTTGTAAPPAPMAETGQATESLPDRRPPVSDETQDDPWAKLEASMLKPQQAGKGAEMRDELALDKSEPDARSPAASARSEPAESPPEPAADDLSGFDFDDLDREPVDELVLSSELNPQTEDELDTPADELDLDFSFSSRPTQEDAKPGASDTDSGFELEEEPELDLDSDLDSGLESEPGSDLDSTQAADLSNLEAELEAALATDSANEPEATEPVATGGMSDSEAEISLDLAGILASTDDSDYARELLDEVIAKGSDAMAARAREIRASLN